MSLFYYFLNNYNHFILLFFCMTFHKLTWIELFKLIFHFHTIFHIMFCACLIMKILSFQIEKKELLSCMAVVIIHVFVIMHKWDDLKFWNLKFCS